MYGEDLIMNKTKRLILLWAPFAACFVFGVWASLAQDGALTYKQPFGPLVDQAALPRRLTKMENGALYFDDARWKWEPAADLALDEKNGYTRLRMLLHRLAGR